MVRHKNRYMVIEINEEGPRVPNTLQIRSPSLFTALIQTIQRLHGDFGVAAVTSGFSAKYCNERTRIAVIRSRHGPHRLVASTIPCVKYVENKRVRLDTLYVGATMKQCFRFVQRHQQRKVDQFCVGLKSAEEKSEMVKAVMNLDPVKNMW